MHPELHRYLDGELPRSALSAEAQAELILWETLEHDIARQRAVRAPEGLTDAVMREVNATSTSPASDSIWRRAWHWLVTPRPIHLRPLAPVAVAVAMIAVIIVPRVVWQDARPGSADSILELGVDEAGPPVIYVQFALRAADAQSVAVAGDFNDWSPADGELRDIDGDGVWRALIAVQPGVHKYMFVVNGSEWVTDPVAERYIDDGFGMRNALLAVTPPGDAL